MTIIPSAIERLEPDSKETGIYLSSREHKPFWSTSEEDIERRKRRLKNTRPEELFSFHGLTVSRTILSPRNHIYWAELDDELVYEADVKIIQLVSNGRTFRVPYQSSVWRDSRHPETAGLPTHVFWEIYNESPNKMLASDLEQSREGRAFWQYRVKEALSKGMKVSINYMSEDGDEGFRDVVRIDYVRALSDLRNAYSTDYATGTESFLLIQR